MAVNNISGGEGGVKPGNVRPGQNQNAKGKDEAQKSQGTKFGEVLGATQTQGSQETASNAGVSGVDKVQLTENVRQADGRGIDEVYSEKARMEKVDALKQQIQDGNYQPDLKKVAASLVRFLAQG